MRFMILVKASKDSEAGVKPSEAVLRAMKDYHEQMARAGVLVGGNGLHPSSKAVRIKLAAGNRTVIDGPFAETKELIAGYTIINVKSRAEALEWAMRMPNPHPENDGEIELREMFELGDCGVTEAIARFRDMSVAIQS